MRKTREEKAITLIALIITIVVLLILAVVAINAVTGDGIIQHATNAKTQYEKAQDEEQDILSYYGEYLENKGDVGPWKQKGDEMTKTNADGTTVKLKIGDIVKYNPAKADDGSSVSVSYTSPKEKNGLDDIQYAVNEFANWKVLGINNGRVILISGNIVDNFEITRGNQYIYGVEELNNISAIYGKGKGALKARSFNETDAENLLGYSREYLIDKSNNMLGSDTTLDYGDAIRYTRNEDNIISYILNGQETRFTSSKSHLFYFIENGEWKTLEKNESKTFYERCYTFDIAYKYNAEREDIVLTTQLKYELLFMDETSKISDYWIANNIVYCTISKHSSDSPDRRLFYALKSAAIYEDDNGIEVGNLGVGTAVSSNKQTATDKYGIRVVVELENNVNLSYNETNKEWNIN